MKYLSFIFNKFREMQKKVKRFSKLFQCITIAALLSTENIYQFPANRREEAKETHRKFHSAEGDLISLLNTYKVIQVKIFKQIAPF